MKRPPQLHARRTGAIAIAVLLLGPLLMADTGTATARTWRVPADAPTIQAGIDSAAVADTVQVAAGTYLEHGILMKGGIVLLGAADAPASVIVDGQQQGRVMDCYQMSAVSEIVGFTFTGGLVQGGWIESLGGGIRCLESDLILRHCRFQANTARIGGGFGFRYAEVLVEDCVFAANEVADPSWAAGGGIWCRDSAGVIRGSTFAANRAFSDDLPGDAGGLFINNGDLEVSDCVFVSNETGGGAGAFYSVDLDSTVISRCHFESNTATWGGALYFETSHARLLECTVVGNNAEQGGAALIGDGAAPVLEDCVFEDNHATAGNGGAIDCWSSAPTLRRLRFEGNSAVIAGGAMNCGGAQPVFEDCVFVDNQAGTMGGALRAHWATLDIARCTFVGHGAPEGSTIRTGTESAVIMTNSIIAFGTGGASIYTLEPQSASVSCSDIFGNAGGDWVGDLAPQLGVDGNIAADPLFCDAASGDLTLDYASPCAAAHSPCGRMGALAAACGTVAVPDTPVSLSVAPPFPNPFNPRTTLSYATATRTRTRIAVHDARGRLVRVLVDEVLPAGAHSVTWDGRDGDGRPLAAGVYLYTVASGDRRVSGRMTLIK